MAFMRLILAMAAALALSLPAAARDEHYYQDALESMPLGQKDFKTRKLNPKYKRQQVDYSTSESPGTIVINTRKRFLYYVIGNGKALRYGIGVGKYGFTWKGTQNVSRKAEWPDWYPPVEMQERDPRVPDFMPGGPGNPLGARALYLGSSEYRIHGTAEPWTIGLAVSSGCIRLTNENVSDLYQRVKIGAKVVVN